MADLLLLLPAAAAGALAGGLTAWLLLRRWAKAKRAERTVPANDWPTNEIDQAASAWANANGRPEATGLIAGKLHLAHYLSRRRRSR